MTIQEACIRHAGVNQYKLRDMCIQQKIRAQKVGKLWHIPVAELDRVFLGKTGSGRQGAERTGEAGRGHARQSRK